MQSHDDISIRVETRNAVARDTCRATLTEDESRVIFERETFAYYRRIKALGWWHPDEGDNTPEALFWRRPDGKYGVNQIEAAFRGWEMHRKGIAE